MPKTIWIRISEEIKRAYPLCKPLFKTISKHFENRHVVSFYTTNALIDDADSQILGTLLGGS